MERKIDIGKALEATLDWFASDETHEALVERDIEAVVLAHYDDCSYVTGTSGANILNMVDALIDTVLNNSNECESAMFLTGLTSILESKLNDFKTNLEGMINDQDD